MTEIFGDDSIAQLEKQLTEVLQGLDKDIDVLSILGQSFSLGKYRLLELLDRGGQAYVFRALDPDLDKEVVIKLYRKGMTESEKADALREGSAMAQVESPNIVQCFAVEEYKSVPFLVLEYVEGVTLTEYVENNRISPADSLRLVRQIATAVDEIHSKGFLHLDLKPSNVMVSADGEPKLIDFGLAQPLDKLHRSTGLGSPAFIAPEQSRQNIDEIGPATDIFGLGSILYYLLTGLPPFVGDTKEEVIQASQEYDLVSPQRYVSSMPDALSDFCLKCLSESPAERFETIDEFLTVARSIKMPKEWQWYQHPMFFVFLIVVGLLITGAVWWSQSGDTGTSGVNAHKERELLVTKLKQQTAKLSRQAFNHELNDDFNHAAELHRQILRIVEDNEMTKELNTHMFRARQDLARNLERLGKYEAVIDTRQEIMKSFGDSPSKNASLVWDRPLVAALRIQAKLPLEKRGRLERGVTYLACANDRFGMFSNEKRLEFLKKAIAAYSDGVENDIRMGLCCYRLASIYYGAKDFELSLIEFRKAHKIYKAQLGVDMASTLKALHFVGYCHMMLDRFDKAEPIFRECIQLNRTQSFDLGMFHVSFGDLFRKKRDFKAAFEQFEKAYQAYKTYSEQTSLIQHEISKAKFEIPLTLNRLAETAIDMKDLDRARSYLAKAKNAYQEAEQLASGITSKRIKDKIREIQNNINRIQQLIDNQKTDSQNQK